MSRAKRIKLIVIAGIVLVAVAAVGAWLAFRPWRVGPYVIVISIDTLRADHVGCYGHGGNITPNIDRLAAESVRFANVISPVPLTMPSHSSMLTGTTPVYHGVHKNESYRLGDSNVTLAETLQAAGYSTGAIVSAFILDSQFGLAQGFETYNDTFPISAMGAKFSERKGEATSRLAVEWLEQHTDDEKFFLFLHYYDPHVEYEPPEPFASQWPGKPYAGEVAYVDHCVGQVIEKLKQLGLYERSLIVLTSDHGEMLGEHGEKTHGYFVYQSAIKVPLMFKPPGGGDGRIVEDIVGLVDIVPTVRAMLDVAPPAITQGRDLTPQLAGRANPASQRYLYCESMMPQNYDANPLLAMVGRRWKYIETTHPELYDLVADPDETTNLYDSHPHQARELSDLLREALTHAGSDTGDSQHGLSESARSRLESLGYVSMGERGRLILEPGKDDPKDILDFHVKLMESMASLAPNRDPHEHIPTMRDLVAERPQVTVARWVLAKILVAEGQYTEALKHYDELARQRPDDAVICSQRGFVREQLGDVDGATADYDRAIGLQDNEAGSRMLRGRLLAKQGQFQEALAYINEVIRLDPSMRGVWYVRGTIHLRLGDLDSALSDLDEALRREPNHIAAHMNRGAVRAQRGDLHGAIEDWADVMRLRPGAISAYVNSARARHQLGDRAGAIADLERCLENIPPDQEEQGQRIEGLISQLRRAP